MPHCQCYMGRTRLQCTEAFSFLLSLNSNSLFQDLTRKGWSENSWRKGKFVFKPQKVFWPGHSLVSPKGWRRNFLTRSEAPKAAKSWTPPAMSVADKQSDLSCFLHGFRGSRVEVTSCFQCSSTAFGQDQPGQQG